jgi:hypothetical protein
MVELGIVPSDANAFLASCAEDGVKVLGWELWIVDHSWARDSNDIAPSPGSWCGGVPIRGETALWVLGGEGDASETAQQLAEWDVAAKVEPAWLPYLRINFTLAS